MNNVVFEVAGTLFPDAASSAQAGRVVQNVKFFRGTNSVVTAEELALEVASADRQIAEGSVQAVDDIDNWAAPVI